MSKASFKHFAITATWRGDKPAPWGDCGGRTEQNWNYHTVRVTNTRTKESCIFDFWASLASPEVRNRRDHLSALSCFVTDALAAAQHNDVDDFAAEFGYTEVSEAVRAWRGCEAALRKAERVIGDESELCDLANELSEAGA